MADLRAGSTAGGSMIWTGANLNLKLNGPIISYGEDRIFTEAYPPGSSDINAVAKTGDTMTGELNIKALGGNNTLLMQSAPNADTAIVLTEEIIGGEVNQGAILKYDGSSSTNGFVLDVVQNKVVKNVFKAHRGTGQAVFSFNPLTLAAQSSAANSLTRRDYVDQVANTRVRKTGDTMTGQLVINKDGAGLILKSTKGGVASNSFVEFRDTANTRHGYVGVGSSGNNDLYIYSDTSNVRIRTNGHTAIDTPRSSVVQENNPAALTRKDYVDEKVGEGSTNKVNRTGDTMTGELSIKTTDNNRLLLASASNKNTSVVMAEAMNGEAVVHGAEVKYEGQNNDFQINVSRDSNSKNVLKANIDDGVAKFTSNPLSIAEQSDEVNALTRKDYVDDQAFRYYLQTTPDVHLPLKHDLHIREGSGDSVAMKDCVFVENKLFFEDNNLTFNVPAVNAVSVNLGDMNGMTKWTPNYNGVNSYVRIPEWKPEGEWEFECDLYITKLGGVQRFISRNTYQANPIIFLLGSEFETRFGGTLVSSKPVIGFNRIRMVGIPPGPLGYAGYSVIGSGYAKFSDGREQFNLEPFKGQISNLRLTDKTNPENSRFYPGVIYSYVDPDAVDVEMPQSTVLVDELSSKDCYISKGVEWISYNKGIWTFVSDNIAGYDSTIWHLNSTGKTVRAVAEVLEYSGSQSNFIIRSGQPQTYTTISSPGVYELEGAVSGGISIYFENTGQPVTTRAVFKLRAWLDGQEIDLRTMSGIMNNFGENAPYVPLLENRKEYLGDYHNSDTFVRGVDRTNNSEMTSSSTKSRPGSFMDTVVSKIPLFSQVESNGVSKRVTRLHSLNSAFHYEQPWSAEVQSAFQYPNTFTVIQPTDEDYKDYLPEVNTKWTPNYNGTNSYVSIPEWKPEGEFEIECNVYYRRGAAYTTLLGGEGNTTNQRSFITFTSSSKQILVESPISPRLTFDASLVEGFNKLLLKLNSEEASLTVNDVELTCDFVVESTRKGYSFIGSTNDPSNYLKGQISNLRLTDKTNPQNSRFYPGIIYDYVDPDATEVHMQQTTRLADWGPSAQHGTMVNFGTTQPFVPLLGDREAYCGDRQDADYVRGVREYDKYISSDNGGSWARNLGPIGSVVMGTNKVPYYILSNLNNVKLDTSDQLQHAFQYPNTFKVIKPDDPDHPDYKEYDWTLNFNGVNSYADIPKWSFSDSVVISFQYTCKTAGSCTILMSDDSIVSRVGFHSNSIWFDGGSMLFTLSQEAFLGTHTLKITKRRYVITEVLHDGIALPLKSGTSVTFKGVDSIGKKSTATTNMTFFKGQISNLRLTDLDNPDNSRFYPIVETAHKMPTGTVVKDELSTNRLVPTIGSYHVSGETGDITFDTNGWIKYTLAKGQKYTVHFKIVAGVRFRLTQPGTGAPLFVWTTPGTYTQTFEGLGEQLFQFDSGVGTGVLEAYSMSEGEGVSTDGTAVNFGTTAPWVPHLEEDEGYVGNYNSTNYIKGVGLTGTPYANRLIGSAGDPLGTIEPYNDRSIAVAHNGATVRKIGYSYNAWEVEVISGTDHEIQQGFQYPNVFTIGSANPRPPTPEIVDGEYYAGWNNDDGYVAGSKGTYLSAKPDANWYGQASNRFAQATSITTKDGTVLNFSHIVDEYTVVFYEDTAPAAYPAVFTIQQSAPPPTFSDLYFAVDQNYLSESGANYNQFNISNTEGDFNATIISNRAASTPVSAGQWTLGDTQTKHFTIDITTYFGGTISARNQGTIELKPSGDGRFQITSHYLPDDVRTTITQFNDQVVFATTVV